jgi:hypothetical protein
MALFVGCLGAQDCTGGPVCGEDGKTYTNSCLARDAGITVAQAGPCKSACEDSDAKDIFNAGSVLAGGKTFSDTCNDSTSIKEYFCEGKEAKSMRVSCPAEYMCSNGKCIQSPCSESDDGMDPDMKGTSTAGSDSSTDSCEEDGSLNEYYCEGGKVQLKTVDCPTGQKCIDGACTEQYCSDSDDGEDIYEAGTTSKGNDSSSDICSGSNAIKEYYCSSDNRIMSKVLSCGTGYECSGGKCIEQEKCTDTDNGKDKYIRGVVTTSSGSYPDDCYSSSQVLEYYCSGDEMKSEKLSCSLDYECKQGKCVEIECSKEVDDFDNRDIRYEIENFGSSDELRLYVGDIVELEDDLILKLHSVSGNQSTFRLYLDLEEFEDNNHECSDTMDEGDSEDDMCGENTNDIEVNEVNDAEDYVDVSLDEYYVVQYFSEEGSMSTWGGGSCPADEVRYAEYDSYFYPYIDTDSTGLNLDGKKFRLFNESAELLEIDIDDKRIEFELDGEDYDLDHSEGFRYNDENYEMLLYFNDGGLYRMLVRLD